MREPPTTYNGFSLPLVRGDATHPSLTTSADSRIIHGAGRGGGNKCPRRETVFHRGSQRTMIPGLRRTKQTPRKRRADIPLAGSFRPRASGKQRASPPRTFSTGTVCTDTGDFLSKLEGALVFIWPSDCHCPSRSTLNPSIFLGVLSNTRALTALNSPFASPSSSRIGTSFSPNGNDGKDIKLFHARAEVFSGSALLTYRNSVSPDHPYPPQYLVLIGRSSKDPFCYGLGRKVSYHQKRSLGRLAQSALKNDLRCVK